MDNFTNFPIALAFDSVLILLSGALLIYCMHLNRNMKRFNESKEGFSNAIAAFIKSYGKAESLLQNVKEGTELSEKTLSHKLERSQKIIDDLDIMISSGNNLANRLEKQAANLKNIPIHSESKKTFVANEIPQSRMEKELLEKILRQSA